MYKLTGFNPRNFIFIWDDNKNISNFNKHGYYLSFGCKIFYDKNAIFRLDCEHPDEERYNLIGKYKKLFFVVYALREDNIIRIISVRKANKFEKERYQNGTGSWL